MTTLADKAILSGADNRPPMLEKDMYDSWKSIMELYMLNRQHGRMILESVKNGPLIWPSIEENGVTRPKKYSKLSATEAVQADCDIKATNIILHGLPPEVYALVSNHKVAKERWERIQLLMQRTSLIKQEREWRKTYLAVGTLRTSTQEGKWKQSGTKDFAVYYNCKGSSKLINFYMRRKLAFLADPRIPEAQATQTSLLSICLSRYALAEVHNHDNMNNNMINQAVQAMPSSEQSNVAAVQNSNSSAQQDALILSVIEQLKTQVVNCTKINLENKSVNDTLTAELERYKEQVKVLKEGQNVDLRSNNNVSAVVHGFQNPFYLKKAQQLEPKLYDGNVIKNTSAIVIPDSEETLMLAEESRSKMLLKQKDPMMLEKKVNTTPVDYVVLNQLSQDFETRFVPQTELSAEQAFWSQNSVNSPDPTLSSRPTKVEVPKELPKVSMVNTSLKKLKHHLAGFDVVVKERTTTTAITEGSWGFEHTKACFRDEIIPFVKALKDLFNTFDQYLIDELSEVQNVFHQMEQACLKLETELLKKKDFIEKKIYDKLFKSFTTLEKHCISLEVDTQLNQEIFQRDNSVSNQSAPSFDQLFELNELKAQSQEKDTVIKKLKDRINALTLEDDLRKLKGKALVDNDVTKHPSDPKMLKIDVEPITPKLLNKQIAHSTYIKHTQEEATILRDLCNGFMLSANPDLCVLDFINNVNARNKSKPVKESSKRKVWKPTGKVVQIVLWYLDFGCSKHMTEDRYQLTNFVNKFLGTVKFGNDHVAKILGYGDYQIGNITISRVYYIEGLGHNLFSVRQFFYSDLEVAFRQHTCFIRNLEGVDRLTGSQGNNLYTLSLVDMIASSPICLLSKASKTKSWLWHRRLSHLNFGAINHLARDGLVRGLPKLKFEKDHMCSACAMSKSKKKPHKHKSEDTNQEKLYLLHMDLYGPIRVTSVNGKKSKDEAPDFIIKFLKIIPVRLKVHVRRIRTYNGTEFVNQTLRDYYEKVGISHETSTARSLQQNGVAERRNRRIIEAARTTLIYAKALLFLWAEVVATTCYTQNRSIIRLRHGKTPYELLHDKLLDLSFFHVFGALCYPTNDSENLDESLKQFM
ncbi:retrovirus-related pol polyprotein from transposon TNT 1-94 [Tanacetum coccineum]